MNKNTIETQHENVKMPDHQFLVNFFSYERDTNGAIFPMHWHEQIELIYLTQGRMRVHCNHQLFEPQAGDLLFINSNELHEGFLIQGPLSLYCMIVDLSMLQSRFVDACEDKYIQPLSGNFILFENLVEQDQEIRGDFEKIAREYQGKEAGYELAIKASIINLIVCMLRKHNVRILTHREYDTRDSNMQSINAALKHIYDNYNDTISLDSLAHQIGLSKYHLAHQFKKLTGKTVINYLNSFRVSQAVNLLQQPHMKVADIATRVGYDDLCYFNRVFRKYTGQTPTQLRKEFTAPSKESDSKDQEQRNKD